MELTNPLTVEERLQVSRIIDHDMMNFSSSVVGNLETHEDLMEDYERLTNPRRVESLEKQIISGKHVLKALSLATHVDLIMGAITPLVQSEGIFANFYSIRDDLDVMEFVSKVKIDCHEDQTPDKLVTRNNLLYGVLFNAVKNARNHGEVDEVKLKLNYQEREPGKEIFVPAGAEKYNQFYGIHIIDNGKGFDPKKLNKELFTKCPEQGERGLGLYFTGLVSKVLRAPIDIQSSEKGTTFSLYHPIYGK